MQLTAALFSYAGTKTVWTLNVHCYRGIPELHGALHRGVVGWININNQAGNFVNWVPYHFGGMEAMNTNG